MKTIDTNLPPSRPIWQLTVNEFEDITRAIFAELLPHNHSPRQQAVGITLLAKELGCSTSFLYDLKKRRVLDEAIISHLGKKVVFDVERARELAVADQERRYAEINRLKGNTL